MDNMEIFCVHWNNYHLHEDVMKMTRLYRHDHLWCVETDRNLSEEYLESDKTKITFVSTKDNEFVGMIDFINYSMDTLTHTHIPITHVWHNLTRHWRDSGKLLWILGSGEVELGLY